MRQELGLMRMTGVALCLALVLGACWGGGGDESAVPASGGGGADPDRSTDAPFGVRLSAGRATGLLTATPAQVVTGDPLDDEVVAGIVDRLPPFEQPDGDRTSFNRPPEDLPRPRVGETVDQPFGPSGEEAPPVVDPGPLEVVRHQPDGPVAVAPFVTVTFNQPMVGLATLDRLDEEDVPVRVTPDLDGRWRWIGATTLRFEHDDAAIDRLPAATEYTVEVPAGTESADGYVLADAVTWRFSTPAPEVVAFSAGEVIGTQPVLVATFDQRVDPAAVLRTTSLRAGDEERALRLADAEEIAADEAARQQFDTALEGRSLAFVPERPLPLDTPVTVEIGPGTPSAEGPLITDEAATFTTRTYAPLAVTGATCGGGGRCRPGDQVQVTFNNPLDLASFDTGDVEVVPELTVFANAFDTVVTLQSPTLANTDYEVTFPASLRDVFGQELGDAGPVRFEVGDAVPTLVPFAGRLLTVDPMTETPSVSVTSIGHATLDVSLYEVDASDFAAYDELWSTWDHNSVPEAPGWRPISSTTVTIEGDLDRMAETRIDLSEAITGSSGHVVVTVSPTESFPRSSEEHWRNVPTMAWVQVTAIGLDALADHDHLVAWATDLRDGTPLKGITVSLGDDSTTTDTDGLATLTLGGAGHLVAEQGDDSAVLDGGYRDAWAPFPVNDAARWYVFDDRGLYRPGEQVRMKGWVRRLTRTDDARIVRLEGNPTVRYVVRDAFGNEVASGDTALDRTGGFDLTADLPLGVALGSAWAELSVEGVDGLDEASSTHEFRIEEFRRPEFEVVTTAVTPAPHIVTDPVTVATEARYFAGGALPDAPVTWQVTTATTTYSPPNWSEFTFGVWQPWWLGHDEGGFVDRGFAGRRGPADSGPCCGPVEEPDHTTYQGRTDASGTDLLEIGFKGERPDQPVTVSANPAVEDVNRQSFASTIDLLVHPASLYVGLRSDRAFVRQGDPLGVDVIVTEIDGDVVAGRPVMVTAARVEQRFTDGGWEEVDVDPETCEVASGDEPVSCSFTPETGGQYRVSATVGDDDGGRNRSELTRWVSGAEAVPDRGVAQQQVTIIPDEADHRPGDTAELLVITPFAPAHGLVTTVRNGIEETRTFQVEEGSTVLELPVTEADVPGFDVRVDVVGATDRQRDDGTVDPSLPQRPAFATGMLSIPVPAVSKTLQVTATPADVAVEPGATTSVRLQVDDAAGKPVEGAEVALVVVDEAVLSLVGYDLPDPIDAFYQPLFDYVRTAHLRSTLHLDEPTVPLGGDDTATATAGGSEAMSEDAAGADSPYARAPSPGSEVPNRLAAQGSGDVDRGPLIDERTNFDALAVFAPDVPTDADGSATVEMTVPDNLTRYRIMAVAADDTDRFGTAESTLTARLPLMVRPSPPRFLNFGDRFELPVVVHNRTDEPLDVDVVVEAANLTMSGPPGKRVSVAAEERVEVRFLAEADDAGTARYRVTAVAGDLADSSSGQLPVYTPVTTEAFATYGVIDGGAVAQPLLTPTGVIPEVGGLEIDTSSTAVQALTDAVVYLAEYPYESADAYASRIIALVSLRDVFAAFAAADVPSPAELDATIRSDVSALVALQGDDGGFSTWSRNGPPAPYTTVQAAHALVAAEAAGYPVPTEAKQRVLENLADIGSRFPPGWDEQARLAVRAYALHVRNLAGDRDSAGAEALYRSGGTTPETALPLDALAWLWPVVDDPAIDAAIQDTLANRVTETPAAATFATDYEESAAALVLASDRRTDAIILDALISERPDSELIPKVVAGLVGNQVKGRWGNVQENSFVLLAMQRYFATFEAQTPSFVARTWLGDTYAAEHRFDGRSVATNRTVIPVAELAGDPDIVLAKEGAGRLYYRLGLRYAPDDLSLGARDEGFVVDRTYEAVEDPADVRLVDGVWQVEPGAMVRVRLTMVADAARTNMALVDSLPAGLEVVSPSLAAAPQAPPEEPPTGEPPTADGPMTWPSWAWFDHQSFRDSRAAAYSAELQAGVYEWSYVARATTPGTFTTPPARAEEIYAPEVFGRSATATVTVGG